MILLSESDFKQIIKDAVAQGVDLAFERRKGEEQAELNKPVLISDVAKQYNIHTKTLLKRANKRNIPKESLKPAKVKALYIPELVRK